MRNNIQSLSFVLVLLYILGSCDTQKQTIRVVTNVIHDSIIVNNYGTQPNNCNVANVAKYNVTTTYLPAQGQNERIKYLVLHYTAVELDVSIRALTGKDVSSHYLVNDTDDDEIMALVAENKRAWHAGVSSWGGKDNLNDTSIGIETVNKGYTFTDNTYTWFPYPDYQIKKIAALAKNIVERYKIEPINVVAHSDIAPDRKFDPGPLFPWEKLYNEYQIGAWYDLDTKDNWLKRFKEADLENQNFILMTQKDLERYGYAIEKSGIWDRQTERVITAFQYHFRPTNYSGKMDAETWATLQALLTKYSVKK